MLCARGLFFTDPAQTESHVERDTSQCTLETRHALTSHMRNLAAPHSTTQRHNVARLRLAPTSRFRPEPRRKGRSLGRSVGILRRARARFYLTREVGPVLERRELCRRLAVVVGRGGVGAVVEQPGDGICLPAARRGVQRRRLRRVAPARKSRGPVNASCRIGCASITATMPRVPSSPHPS